MNIFRLRSFCWNEIEKNEMKFVSLFEKDLRKCL